VLRALNGIFGAPNLVLKLNNLLFGIKNLIRAMGFEFMEKERESTPC
jgi:hypothetical protein